MELLLVLDCSYTIHDHRLATVSLIQFDSMLVGASEIAQLIKRGNCSTGALIGQSMLELSNYSI